MPSDGKKGQVRTCATRANLPNGELLKTVSNSFDETVHSYATKQTWKFHERQHVGPRRAFGMVA
jgi:hypothetical protein